MVDATIQPPRDADVLLASSISESLYIDSDVVTDAILRCQLREACSAAVKSRLWSERNALRLIAKFDGVLDLFLVTNNYSSEKLKVALREELSETEVESIIIKCVDRLETLLAEFESKGENIARYVKFVSIVVDSRFVDWFVRSGKMGGALSRLAVLMKGYRRALFTHQQERMKSEGSRMEKVLKHRSDPKSEGKVHFHKLK